PRTGTEEVLAEIWREVLGVEQVGRGDGFFALGGHSLLAARTVSRIRRELGVDLPLRELFNAQTLEALAAKVDAERAREGGIPDAPIARVPRDPPPPLSPAQERLWFLQRLTPESTAFNMPMLLRIRGRLDAEVLRRALEEIVRRHEALRTTFARTPGGPVQVIHPAGDRGQGTGDSGNGSPWFHLPFTDLSAEPDPEGALRPLLDTDAATPFDLAVGPLLRLHLVRLGDDAHALLVGMHHVISDGWSMERFYAELTALYTAFLAGQPSPLPELPVQYADFAVWQRGWLQGEWLPRQMEYWRQKLEGAPVLELPSDRARTGLPALAGGDLETTLPRDVADRLESVGHAEGATPFMTFLAAYAALLHRWSGDADLVVGTAVAGRNRPELEGLIGFFLNTLALRIDLSGDPSFRELLRRVRRTAVEAYAHQDVPFGKLVEELKVERSLGHQPLTQVAFTLQHEQPLPHPAGLEMWVDDEAGETHTAKVDLTLGVVRGAGDLRVSWEYAADLFDHATIVRQAERFGALARAAADHPDAPLSELLSGEAAQRVHPVAPKPAPAQPSDAAPPRGELERTVAAAWREVLGRDDVGVNDNFFEIGGHSLLLARLQDVLEKALGREVALVDLFRRPTIRTFAASLAPVEMAGSASSDASASDAAQPSGARRGEERG
ncbi:MAG TPA: condensation domain-containing protein, partial [Longimicrobium sp.]